MHKIKILCIMSGYYPAIQFGGPIVSTHEQNRALVRQGINVEVLTSTAGLTNCFNSKMIDSVPVTFCPFWGNVNLTFSPHFFYRLIITMRHYDCVHIHGFWSLPLIFAIALARLYRKPLFITPNGSLLKFALAKGKIKAKRWVLFLAQKLCNQNLATIIYTSFFEKRNSMTFPYAKSTVIYNAINLKEFQKNHFDNIFSKSLPKNYFLYLGRLLPIKRIELGIKLLAQLTVDNPNMYFIICGPDENHKASLIKTSNQFGVQRKVIFLDLIHGNKKKILISRAHFLIQFSKFESFGMSIVEAMALGTPVVVTKNIGVCPLIEKHKAGIITKHIDKKLAQDISRLLTNSKYRNLIVNNAISVVATHFDIDKTTKSLITMYKKLIKTKY